ncbi:MULTISPECIES: PIN domain-containing protein [unclassified Oceanispirochaeta]|uniref:PIN domain-containing protein n=1 Tax=unclassified Oceanispirochaeta TaxID=2635722 RepID=UPI000E09C9B3|nr:MULTISPECIES: PIN domain-containing protein [unclassified Oceanispirochaeta]MBF9018483.1 hypothetical protein [Oceanispirochaeta sp. M2]NPD74890.1 hypothetical protein [Oceanispirochaeta sp. M1]RDG29277.1 hypothetical protein DV872_22595 [Oceanispirochaeta sp. M1]
MKKIYFDTEFFQSLSYNFASKKIDILKQLSTIDVIDMRISSVVDEENNIRIKKKIKSLKSIVRKNKSDFYILNSCEKTKNLLSEEKIEELEKDIIESYDIFKKDFLTIVTNNTIEIDTLLNLYFKESPPFNKELKKHEFPDAFSVLMIKEDIQDDDEVIIVSNDKDISDLIKGFDIIDKVTIFCNISDLLDHFSKESDFYEDLLQMINKEEFTSELEKIFDDISFQANGFHDPEIEERSLISIDGIKNIKILDIEDEYVYFSLVGKYKINFNVESTDPDSWHYDSEDKVAYYFEKINYETVKEIDITIYFEMLKNEEWEIETVSPEDYVDVDFEPNEDRGDY